MCKVCLNSSSTSESLQMLLSAKRRSMISTTQQTLIYVKVNIQLVPHDELPVEVCFDSTAAIVHDAWMCDIVEAAEQHELESHRDIYSIISCCWLAHQCRWRWECVEPEWQWCWWGGGRIRWSRHFYAILGAFCNARTSELCVQHMNSTAMSKRHYAGMQNVQNSVLKSF